MELSFLGDELLVTLTFALGALRLGQANPFRTIYSPGVADDQARPVEYLQLGLGLTHFELPANVTSRHLVATSLHVEVALEIDDSGVNAVDGGAPERQGPGAGALGGGTDREPGPQ